VQKNIDDLSVSFPHGIVQGQLVEVIRLSGVHALGQQKLNKAQSFILVLDRASLEKRSLVKIFSVISQGGHFQAVIVHHIDDFLDFALGQSLKELKCQLGSYLRGLGLLWGLLGHLGQGFGGMSRLRHNFGILILIGLWWVLGPAVAGFFVHFLVHLAQSSAEIDFNLKL
jgi:hypothetical protein